MKIEMLVWHIRATKGISLRTLSSMSGISKSTINRIENNKTIPNIIQLILLAEALDCQIQDLYIPHKQ